MAALCLQMTLHDQVAFTTYNIPLARVGVTLHDQVPFLRRSAGSSLPTTDTSRPGRLDDVPQAKDGRSFPSTDTSRPNRLYDVPQAKDGRSLRTGDT